MLFKTLSNRINVIFLHKFYRNVHSICSTQKNVLNLNPIHQNHRNRSSLSRFCRNFTTKTKTNPQNLFEYFEQIDSSIFKNEINQQRPSQLKFVPYENLFAYNVLKNIDNYQAKVGRIIAECPKVELQLAENLHKLISLTDLNEEEVSKMIEYIDNQISKMDEMQIIGVLSYLLKSLPVYQNANDWSKTFMNSPLANVYQLLDRTSAKILNSSDDSEETMMKMLAISELWFEMGFTRNVQFNRILIAKILNSSKNPDKLSLLNLMFCMNVNRSISPQQVSLVSFKVDSLLDQPDSSLTLDELSIIAMGYFKTQTRMPYRTLTKFMEHLRWQLHTSGDARQSCNTISVVSCLKLIRFSLNTIEFDARLLKNDVQSLVNIICNDNPSLLDSSICLTHLISLLNSAFLHNSKKLYKLIFDKLILNLDTFRIKDIERILFCLSNVMFRCPPSKLNQLENYLLNLDQSQIYPYHIYNITLFLLTIDYYPHKLIKLCCDPKFLQKSIEFSKLNLYNTVLTTDSIVRLELPNSENILKSPEQIDQFKQNQDKLKVPNTKKDRYLKAINDSLSEHFGPNFRMMYLFPFSLYPFPVILNDELRDLLMKTNNDKIQVNSIFGSTLFPYTFEHLKGNYFKNCTAIQLLLNKDFNYAHSLRGPSQLHQRLLERLGFRVVQLRQHQLKEIKLPEKGQFNQNYSQQMIIDLILNQINQQSTNQQHFY